MVDVSSVYLPFSSIFIYIYLYYLPCLPPGLCVLSPSSLSGPQINDATRDGLRAVKAALDDKALVPGAGAFEVACYRMLMRRKGAVSE